MKRLLDSILWEPLQGGNGVTQMNEFAEYFLIVTYPVFIFARAMVLHWWEVDLYPVVIAQTHLGAIIGIAGIIAYKQSKKLKHESRSTDSKKA
jgi:hypothetical protein